MWLNKWTKWANTWTRRTWVHWFICSPPPPTHSFSPGHELTALPSLPTAWWIVLQSTQLFSSQWKTLWTWWKASWRSCSITGVWWRTRAKTTAWAAPWICWCVGLATSPQGPTRPESWGEVWFGFHYAFDREGVLRASQTRQKWDWIPTLPSASSVSWGQ